MTGEGARILADALPVGNRRASGRAPPEVETLREWPEVSRINLRILRKSGRDKLSGKSRLAVTVSHHEEKQNVARLIFLERAGADG